MMNRAVVHVVLGALALLWTGIARAESIHDIPDFSDRQDSDAEEDDGSGVVIEDEKPAEPGAAEDVELSIFRELKTVESQVDDLKEKVFRSKARLLLLEEKVIRGVVSGAKGIIRHVNNLGPAYELQSITYYFDGNPIFQQTEVGSKGGLSKLKKEDIFEANIPPGNHTLSVTGVIKGKGAGLFAYLSDYSFQFSSSYSFVATDGKTSRVDATLFKKGGALADYVEGPAVEFKLLDDKGKKPDAPEAPAATNDEN